MDINTLERQEKNKNSLKLRITFFFIFFLAAVFAVFVITSVLQINTVTKFVCSQYAAPAVEEAIKEIRPGAFEKLSISLDPADPYYVETQQNLLKIKEKTRCLYLYTMAQAEGTVFNYIIDGSDVPGGSNFSTIGESEDISFWDKAALKAFTTGTGQLGTIDQNENYGATISAYEPIINNSGKTIGLMACDIDATNIVEWIKTQVLWQLGIVFILFAVGLAVYITMIKLVNKSFA